MKLRISSSLFLLALTTQAFASHPAIEHVMVPAPGKLYLGVFGGGGGSNHIGGTHFGSAFYTEAKGGPMAVDAIGQVNHEGTGTIGAQLGYQVSELCLHPCSQWKVGPAVELEGYYMTKSSFNGDMINTTPRLPEHDFVDTFPMKRTVFLGNAVLNFNHAACQPVHPYIGFGIGSAIVKIKDAIAEQVDPPEAGVNHFNTDSNDAVSTFAGQIKLGLSYDVNRCFSFFADYRWLYLADTHFVFGSTAYAGHAETSSWHVKLTAQRYNLGNVGVRYNWG